ncbi:Bicarbonate transporter, eukaryotic [Metarhizium album ARSEF 1941]|uniref:Bicarbonate transporter, eukaryotic n=1 Tax=Metarhizium album (strain ARSEF 1941) TaxID=1081103 RepID=A0A0B2X7M8_METAS|nr:Bicarbonate transporter, eukaryotic [Metarhizium album ARSEF 1941]KHO01520.1 Bicarbonate transporter, eukaryotic [Metarhizium album ARSEF 1941]
MDDDSSRLPAGEPAAAGEKGKWYEVHLFRGMANDVRRRAPYYGSDWMDAWDYRVVPATVYMYFANILPALAFSLDMFSKTGSNYGVNEVLLASVMGAVVFSVFAAQPLVIVGVTVGHDSSCRLSSLADSPPPSLILWRRVRKPNARVSTVYDIMKDVRVDYVGFMAWIGIWSLVLHVLLAVTNSCNWLRWVTRFPCDIFGFYVAFIYIQKGIQVLDRLADGPSFYLSIIAALLVSAVAYVCGQLGRSSLFTHPVRVFLKDYGTPLTIIFFTGFVHIGRMARVHLDVLPTGIAFEPTSGRAWVVPFWNLSVGQVFIALPFAVLLTILFWFDHNVSSLIAQGSEFPLRKPPGFHWDIFLLGITTGVAGILGLPFPNGLIPQAPFHTESLCVTKPVKRLDEKGQDKGDFTLEATHVVEQRLSNLAQGLLTLGTMTAPLLVVLHLIPQGVLAGLFFVMGVQALEANGITAKLVFLARDAALTPPDTPLRAIKRRSAVWLFVAMELLGFGATFAITQTVAAIGFPVFILLLIPLRALVLPRVFRPEELDVLDAPTASDFTMEGIGGSWGGAAGASSSSSSSSPPPPPRSGDETAVSSRSGSRGPYDSVLGSPAAARASREEMAELGRVTRRLRAQPTSTNPPAGSFSRQR